MRAATKTDWKTKKLPSRHRSIRLSRTFSMEEMQRIQLGLIPRQMEDKWFIYWQDRSLYFHRSWTGVCIYVVRFENDNDAFRMYEADLNREPRQYTEKSDVRDAAMISYLIDVLLLGQEAAFPSDDADGAMGAAMQWSHVGRAMLGPHHQQDEMAEPSGEPE